MRIGLISGEYPPMHGGVGDYTRELAQALVAVDHEVFVLTDQRAQPGFLGNDRLTIDPIINHWNWNSLLKVRRWSKERALDVINVQYETAAYGMSAAIHLLPRFVTVPTITTFHDLRVPYLFPKAGKLRNQAIWLLARQSVGVIATDSTDAVRLREVLPRKPVIQIPIGSNIPTLTPDDFDRIAWRTAHGIPSQTCLIGYFGFMNTNKGLELLVDGLAYSVKDGLDMRLVMIGGGETESDPDSVSYAESIRARIASVSLTDHTQWTGFISTETVSAWLLSCDVIALPFTDGVSMRRGSFLAALSHGCTILTTQPQMNIPGIDSVAAFIPMNTPASMAYELSLLVKNPAQRQTLANNGKNFAQQFSWATIAAKSLSFYATCLTG